MNFVCSRFKRQIYSPQN